MASNACSKIANASSIWLLLTTRGGNPADGIRVCTACKQDQATVVNAAARHSLGRQGVGTPGAGHAEFAAIVPRGALLLFGMGFTNFARFAELTVVQVTWLTRAKSNLKYEDDRCLYHISQVRDRLVWIGEDVVRQQVRLIEVCYHGRWYRYLTNECDPVRLMVAACQRRCSWRLGWPTACAR